MFQEYSVIKLKRELGLGDLPVYKVQYKVFIVGMTLIVDQGKFIGLYLFKTLNIQKRVEILLPSVIF